MVGDMWGSHLDSDWAGFWWNFSAVGGRVVRVGGRGGLGRVSDLVCCSYRLAC